VIEKLPTRERELFDSLYERGEATATELQQSLDGAPGNSAVRVMLARLEKKGLVTHRRENNRFVYSPAVPEPKIRQSAIHRFVRTYFKGSPANAAAALIGMAEKVSQEELDELETIIAKARGDAK
jgi:predicted transcriptional regulator